MKKILFIILISTLNLYAQNRIELNDSSFFSVVGMSGDTLTLGAEIHRDDIFDDVIETVVHYSSSSEWDYICFEYQTGIRFYTYRGDKIIREIVIDSTFYKTQTGYLGLTSKVDSILEFYGEPHLIHYTDDISVLSYSIKEIDIDPGSNPFLGNEYQINFFIDSNGIVSEVKLEMISAF